MTRPFVPAAFPPGDRTEPAMWFAFAGDKLLFYENSTQAIPRANNFAELGLFAVRQQYLGTLAETRCFAVELPPKITPPAGMLLKGLREAYPRLGELLFAVAGRAIQIIDWDRNHQFCGRCGSNTVDAENERAKRCPQCGLLSYPRLSPAIIVRVSRGHEILLARAPRWPDGMYSVLAGFVEPGETLEQAVEREVHEETGISLKNIRYFGSQPWPFPNSLMIAFTAEHAAGEIQIDPSELENAGWYTAANLPGLPSKMSIARRLVDDFLTT